MKIQLERDGSSIESNKVVIILKSGNRYRLTEDNEGNLRINKTWGEDTERDSLSIFPCVGNEIAIK